MCVFQKEPHIIIGHNTEQDTQITQFYNTHAFKLSGFIRTDNTQNRM